MGTVTRVITSFGHHVESVTRKSNGYLSDPTLLFANCLHCVQRFQTWALHVSYFVLTVLILFDDIVSVSIFSTYKTRYFLVLS